jgi:DNA-binding HxlR family transcriptional regulator
LTPDFEPTIPQVLRLVGAGATGAILMALGEGPLRTKELTERVPGYAPRTIYRYSGKLAELEVIEREEQPGVPSNVTHALTEPKGRELYQLVAAYANASFTRFPDGRFDAHAWGSLAMLADLWESGLIEELNLGPKSPTELARVEHGLSYHQVNRRAGLFTTGGFLRGEVIGGKQRIFELTDGARRGMALIAGIGRWRRRHVVPGGTSGLTAREAGGVLRTALPLVTLPRHEGKSFGIEIAPENGHGDEADAVWAIVEAEGNVLSCEGPLDAVDGQARGKVSAFVDTILDGPRNGLRLEGDERLVTMCFERLHSALWEGQGNGLAASGDDPTDEERPELSYN